MKTHETTVYLPAEDIKRANRLLRIPSLEELTEKQMRRRGLEKFYEEGLYQANFDDGSFLTCDLHSGSNNYWDCLVWYRDKEDSGTPLDCWYEFGDLDFVLFGERYIVHVKKAS